MPRRKNPRGKNYSFPEGIDPIPGVVYVQIASVKMDVENGLPYISLKEVGSDYLTPYPEHAPGQRVMNSVPCNVKRVANTTSK